MTNYINSFAEEAQKVEEFRFLLMEPELDPKKNLELVSPAAACLHPFLLGIDWKGSEKELDDALPYFKRNLDLIDVRNILANLNITTKHVKTKITEISDEQLPAIFQTDENNLFVIYKVKGKYHYYDSQKRKYVTSTPSFERGQAIITLNEKYFKDKKLSQKSWMQEFLGNYRKLIIQFLAITFLSTIISLSVPVFILLTYDRALGTNSHSTLMYLAIGVLFAIILEFCIRTIRSYGLSFLGARLEYVLGTEVLKKILHLPANFTERAPIGGQMARLREFESIKEFFTSPLIGTLLELPFIVIFIAVIGLFGGTLFFVPVVLILLFLVLGFIYIPSIHRSMKKSNELKSKKNAFQVELFSNMRNIKYIGAENIWLDRYIRKTADSTIASLETSKKFSNLQIISSAIMMISGLSFLVFGTQKVINGDMSTGALIATLALGWRVLTPIQVTFNSVIRIDQLVTSIKHMNQLMSLQVEHERKDRWQKIDPKGDIEFVRVSLKYQQTKDPALLGFNYHIHPGECIGIIGPSLSGKSTILKIIQGIYPAQAGLVKIDQIDSRQIDGHYLRSKIAYVPQNPHFFYGTIYQNLKLSNPLAKRLDIEEATKKAHVYEEIMLLPDKFDTKLTDYSEGQFSASFIQRLALAQAYIKNAKIMLFDDPGRNLDKESNEALIKLVKNFKGKSTIVLVSHRPEHLMLTDKVLYLNKGQLEMAGPAKQILEQLSKDE